MGKLVALFFLSFLQSVNTSAAITIIAVTQPGKSSVTLQWNMPDYPGETTYTLFKSKDGVVWIVSAANPVLRNYTPSTILAYKDNFSGEQKLSYRVKVYDANKNIVDISNIVIVENPVKMNSTESLTHKNVLPPSASSVKTSWQIYPNPVSDLINLVYRGNDVIRGVINVTIQDANGKTVIKFRGASNNKQLHIPVSKLRTGFYFIRIDVLNELQMNQKFIKQ